MSNFEFWNELGKIFNAVVAYQEKSIEFNKQFISPWIRLGNVFEKQDRNDKAIDAYRKAIELDPGNAQNWYELGNLYFHAESYDEAVDAFNKAIELNATCGWAYCNLGLTFVTQGKYADAVPLYQKSIDLLAEDKEKAIAWNRLGNVYRKLDDYENAILAFQRSDDLDSENAGFCDALDDAIVGPTMVSDNEDSAQEKELDLAGSSIRLIVQENQTVEADALVELEDAPPVAVGSNMESGLSDTQTTIESLSDLTSPQPFDISEYDKAQESSSRVESDVAFNEYQFDALDLLDSIAQSSPSTADPEKKSEIAENADTETEKQSVGPTAEAAPISEETFCDHDTQVLPACEEPDPDWLISTESFDLSGQPCIDMENTEQIPEDADHEFPELGKELASGEPEHFPEQMRDPAAGDAGAVTSIDDGNLPVEQGAVETYTDSPQIAGTSFGAADFSLKDSDGSDIAFPLIDSDVALSGQQVESGIERENTIINPKESSAVMAIEDRIFDVTTLSFDIQAGDFETSDAEGIDSQAGQASEDLQNAPHKVVEEYLNDNDEPSRLAALETNDVMPESSDPSELKEPVTRIDTQGEVQIEADTKNAHVWNELGNVYFNNCDYDDAIVAYSKAIELDRRFAWPYSNLALAYVKKERFAEAILLYQRSIELFTSDKDKAISWNRLGNVYRRLNDYGGAIAAYQRADELDPENTTLSLQSRFGLLGSFFVEQKPSFAG